MDKIAVAQSLLRLLGGYVALGILFATVFVVRGVGKIDAAATTATPGFRLIIFPGAVLFWPWLAKRWWQAGSVVPRERNAHRDAASR